MITLNCSQCHARLDMDDAFAGGVCRCQYCGTIQTVPAQPRRVDRAAAPPPSASPPQARGSNGAPVAAAHGLDALAQVVADGGRALEADAPSPVDYSRPVQQGRRVPLLVVLLVALALVLGLLCGYFLTASRLTVVSNPPVTHGGISGVSGGARTVGPRSTTSTTDPGPEPVPRPGSNGGNADPGRSDPTAAGATEGGDPAARKAPGFCGISLQGVPSVVYVLDRGQATADLLDALKEATYRSLETLKPDQKFQVIFWDNGGGTTAYPADGFAPASPRAVEAAQKQFADVLAGGRARADTAIQQAAANKPAVIILVTGKAYDLEEELLTTTRDAIGGGATKVHTVALRSDDNSQVLQGIAQSTHGEFKLVTAGELRAFSY